EGERSQDFHVALVVQELGRHGGKAPAVKEVHEEGFENVFPVMAEDKGGTAFFARDAVKMAAPQPRAEGAIGPAFGDFVGHNRISVLILDAVGHAEAGKVVGKNVFGEIRLTLVEIAGE